MKGPPAIACSAARMGSPAVAAPQKNHNPQNPKKTTHQNHPPQTQKQSRLARAAGAFFGKARSVVQPNERHVDSGLRASAQGQARMLTRKKKKKKKKKAITAPRRVRTPQGSPEKSPPRRSNMHRFDFCMSWAMGAARRGRAGHRGVSINRISLGATLADRPPRPQSTARSLAAFDHPHTAGFRGHGDAAASIYAGRSRKPPPPCRTPLMRIAQPAGGRQLRHAGRCGHCPCQTRPLHLRGRSAGNPGPSTALAKRSIATPEQTQASHFTNQWLPQ